MVTLKEAIKIAEANRKSKVTSASDCNDRWAFYFEDDEPPAPETINDPRIPDWVKPVLVLGQRMPAFVYKDSGKVEYFLFSFLVDSVQSGEITFTPIELPE